jgi:hypothetical protein
MGDRQELAEAVALRGQLVEVPVLGKPHVADLVGLRGIVVDREPRFADARRVTPQNNPSNFLRSLWFLTILIFFHSRTAAPARRSSNL